MNPQSEIESHISKAQTLDEMAAALGELISGPYSVSPDGILYYIKQLVDRQRGMKIEVFSREHAPPHFHVIGSGVDATFLITDGSYLNGNIDGRTKAMIKWWYTRSREKLIHHWNNTRPSDCPVGPMFP